MRTLDRSPYQFHSHTSFSFDHNVPINCSWRLLHHSFLPTIRGQPIYRLNRPYWSRNRWIRHCYNREQQHRQLFDGSKEQYLRRRKSLPASKGQNPSGCTCHSCRIVIQLRPTHRCCLHLNEPWCGLAEDFQPDGIHTSRSKIEDTHVGVLHR